MLPFEKVKRKVLVKKESGTNPSLGCKPEERTTKDIINYGVINIDKPKGPTSHQVSDFVQKILNIKKSGHSGTLDPSVTGVLPVAIGSATKVVQVLLSAGKEYVAIMHLHKEIPEKDVKKAFTSFTGKIMQKPPIKSAVKRVLREREIYYLELIEMEGKDVLFRVGCQAGTYIRKLIHDIGAKLGCGAHMAELRRTKAGPFNEESLCTLQDLQDAFHYYKKEQNDRFLRKIIQPVEKAVRHLPMVWAFDTAIEPISHGTDLKVPGISKLHDKIKKDQEVAIMSLKDELVALGKAKMSSKEIMRKEKGIAVKTNRVFTKPGVYEVSVH